MTTLDKIIQELLRYQKNLETADFSNPDEIKDLGHNTRHTKKLHDDLFKKISK